MRASSILFCASITAAFASISSFVKRSWLVIVLALNLELDLARRLVLALKLVPGVVGIWLEVLALACPLAALPEVGLVLVSALVLGAGFGLNESLVVLVIFVPPGLATASTPAVPVLGDQCEGSAPFLWWGHHQIKGVIFFYPAVMVS